MMVYLACTLCVLGVLFLRTLGNHLLPSDVGKDVFGSKKRLDAFLSSQRVTAERLHYKGDVYGVKVLTNYDRDSPVQVAPADIQMLKRLLIDRSSYPWVR